VGHNLRHTRIQPAIELVIGTIFLGGPFALSRGTPRHRFRGRACSTVNNRDGNRTQNFVYDSLNRIQQAYSSGPKWGETYSSTASAPGVAPATSGIDAWGNMTNHTGVTGKTATEGTFACPANTNNQLTTCGLTYDAAGNAYINNGVTYTYDVENRLVTPGTGNGTYLYDGDGNRMARLFNTSGTEYWRDLGGESAAGGLQHWRQSPRVHLFCGEEGCPP
jgi:hypothetical protein